MGGKALNKFGVYTERKNSKEFRKIRNEIQNILNTKLQLISKSVLFYKTKSNHGDLDLLIKIPKGFHIKWYDFIKKTFQPNGIYSNGNVYSFDYDNFQIDFILIKEEYWEIAQIYFAYDPLGNIMGKTFHKFGLSYGWKGLYYKYRNHDGINIKDILITRNPQKIFEFGGYDFERFIVSGFDYLEEIFEYCINSKYFSSDIFQFNNLKTIDKKRNRKRNSYKKFLEYINNKNINKLYSFNKDKNFYIEMINDFFPESNLIDILKILDLECEKKKTISNKFNGNIVMEWLPELKGVELGRIISLFKKSFIESYDDYILKTEISKIKEDFFKIYEKNKRK